jgi:hypothetical protein
MINNYVISATIIIISVFLLYFIRFYVILEYKISDDPSVWGQLGDYTGGIINPILSFISIILLIKSLTIQTEANISLRNEIKNNEKTEKLRSFETLFFNMINSQKELFNCFKIESIKAGEKTANSGVKAVIEIEEEIRLYRKPL